MHHRFALHPTIVLLARERHSPVSARKPAANLVARTSPRPAAGTG